MTDWITHRWAGERPIRLLDFGCGDLLLARRLPETVVVDGFDISESARAAAGRTLSELGPGRGRVYSRVEEIPEAVFDGVVMSSVLQYIAAPSALGELLADVAGWLRPGGLGAVATDVVRPDSNRLCDGIDLLRFLVRREGLMRGSVVALRTTRRSPGDLLPVGEDELFNLAERSGLVAQRLPENLSPLEHRSSYELRRLGVSE